MLNEIAKTRIRVHLGVPVAGIQQTGSVIGYRYTQQIGLLEYRMNNLQPLEEIQLTGVPSAVLGLTGVPVAGATVSVTIGTGAQITYTVTAADVAAPVPIQSVSQNFAAAITAAGQNYLGNYGIPPTTSPAGQFPYTGIVIITPTSLTAGAFTVAVAHTGGTIPYIQQQGVTLPPTVTFAESGTTVNGYIAICDYLEGRAANSSDLIKFSKADVVTLRMNELAERENIYEKWCQRLADFLGIARYPMGRPGGVSGMNTGMIV